MGKLEGVDVFDMNPIEMTRMGTVKEPIPIYSLVSLAQVYSPLAFTGASAARCQGKGRSVACQLQLFASTIGLYISLTPPYSSLNVWSDVPVSQRIRMIPSGSELTTSSKITVVKNVDVVSALILPCGAGVQPQRWFISSLSGFSSTSQKRILIRPASLYTQLPGRPPRSPPLDQSS